MQSNLCRSSTTSIYMLSITDFDPKGTISEARVHAGATFGHTGCWLIAKCRFSMKLSRSFDHHGKTLKEMVKKKISKMKIKSWRARRSVRKIDEYVIDYACEGACVKVANVMSVKKCLPGGCSQAPTRTPCVYRFIVPIRWRLIIVCRLWSPLAYGLTGQ